MVMDPHDIPGTFRDNVPFPAHAAATATEYIAVWTAPFNCTVTAIKVAPITAVTGANTNTTHLNAVGPSSATEVGNIDLVSGTDLAAGVLSALTMAANVNFTTGQSLRLEAEKVLTGLAVPIGVMVVEYESR